MKRLSDSKRDQSFPELFKPNKTVKLKTDDRTVRINAQRFPKEPVTVFIGKFHGDSAPVTLSGYYRIGIGNRIFSSFGLLALILIGGGMTLVLTYAAIFGTWSNGSGIRFYLPLFPLVFTVGMLCFLNYLSKPNPNMIETFLFGAIEASNINQSEKN